MAMFSCVLPCFFYIFIVMVTSVRPVTNSTSQDTGSDCGLAGGNNVSGAGNGASLTVGLAAGPVQAPDNDVEESGC